MTTETEVAKQEYAKMLQEIIGKATASVAEIKTKQRDLELRQLELEQKGTRPIYSGGGGGGANELAELLIKSDGASAMQKGSTPSFSIELPANLLHKNTIINATGQNQPLVPSDRGPGYIINAPEQRLTVRSLFRQIPTNSNLIERASEATYTNAARPQGDTSPGGIEGELKAESSMTFTLSQVPVVTLAHHIIASRQILGDAPLLQAHLETRLLYGLNLEEEEEFLTGDGTAGTVNGINNQATAFSGGATNQTRLDSLASAANQLARSNYEPSGYILAPLDWLAVMLEKDANNRYMFADPAAMVQPRLWGLPVIVTPSQTAGRFTCIDAARFGYVADRETATVRISENVADQFIRNLITILCEKRTTLVTELAAAAVYGTLATPG